MSQSRLTLLVRSLRNSLSLSTWILLAALLVTLLTSVVPKAYIVAPALIILLSRAGWTVAVTTGLLPNPYLKGAILSRTSAQIPDINGQFSDKGASESVACLHLGAKFNHPLGILSPNVKAVGESLYNMVQELDEKRSSPATAAQVGYLGGTFFERRDANECLEVLFISYWRSAEDIHNYAYGPMHRKTWEWWNRLSVEESKHIGINHEIFAADKGNWETVYVNFQPTMLGATSYRKQNNLSEKDDSGQGQVEYVSPLIQARSGPLRTSAGRLGRTANSLGEKYGYKVTQAVYD